MERNDAFDEMLDEIYPVVQFGNLTYSPSEVLAAVDPIAYRCAVADFEDSEDES